MFAVIALQGHQYIVRENDEIIVDLLELESTTYVCDQVLLVAEEDGSKTIIGKPTVPNTIVTFDVVTDAQKGEKIRVTKFKRKNRYQRIIWFRPHQTVLKVLSIGAGEKEQSAAKKESAPQKESVKKVVKSTKPATKKESAAKE